MQCEAVRGDPEIIDWIATLEDSLAMTKCLLILITK